MSEFQGYRYHLLLNALYDAAKNYVALREEIKAKALIEKTPFIDDYESYLVSLDRDIEKANKALSTYSLALKSVASPR